MPPNLLQKWLRCSAMCKNHNHVVETNQILGEENYLLNASSLAEISKLDEVKCILHGFKAARYLGTVPYNWIEGQGIFGYTDALHIRFLLQFIVYLSYEAFVVGRWIHSALFFPSQDTSELAYVAISYGIPVVLHTCNFFNARNLPNLFNRLQEFMQNDLKNQPKKRTRFGLRFWAKVAKCVSFLVISLNLTTIFRRPQAPHLLTSLLQQEDGTAKWKLAPFLLIHGYIWCNQWLSTYIAMTAVMTQVYAVQTALTSTLMRRSWTKCFEETRKLEILQGNFNALWRWCLWGAEVVGISLCVFGFCGSLRGEGALAVRLFVVASFTTVALIKIWSGLGAVVEKSTHVRDRWKGTARASKLYRRQIASIRPIRVQIGG